MQATNRANPNFNVWLIIAAAIGSALFTLIASLKVYENTKDLIGAASWVEHTQEVMTTLQSATQGLDRIEASTKLYLSTGDDEQIAAAHTGLLRVVTSIQRLHNQVADNPSQAASADELEAGTRNL